MQEITIRERSVYSHYVHVDSNKELCWTFSTRRKGISFGLFRQIDTAENVLVRQQLASAGLLENTGAVAPIVPVVRTSIAESSFSQPDVRGSVSSQKIRKEGKNVIPKDSTCIIPIARICTRTDIQIMTAARQASKEAISFLSLVHSKKTGNLIKSILLFDNTFSVKTQKRLFFFVAVRDIEPREIVNRKEIEGWLLKKGKRTMQGYQRRWVEVHSSGVLTYCKTPGG